MIESEDLYKKISKFKSDIEELSSDYKYNEPL